MTDYPPRSAVHRFGVSLVGPTFSWTHLDDGLNPVEETYRAHPGFSFDDQLNYQSVLAVMQAQAQLEANVLTKRLEELTAQQTSGEITEEQLLELTRIEADAQQVQERARFQLVVDQVLLLVHPDDRERLHPHLATGNSVDVRELRNWLQEIVVQRVALEVAAAGGVDPT